MRTYGLIGLALSALLFSSPVCGKVCSTNPSDTELPIEDIVIGDLEVKSPVEVFVYTAFSCTHCSQFHKILQELIDHYKTNPNVRFVLRDFPIDKISLQAALLARLNHKEDYLRIANALFEKQEAWLSAKDPLSALKKIVIDLGIPSQEVEKALTNKKTETQLLTRCVDGIKQYKIDSTPTVVVHDKIIRYAADLKELITLVNKELKKKELKKAGS